MAEAAAAPSGTVPEFDELKLCIKAIKDANPEMGVAKVHAAVKAEHGDWQVSQDRVKKILADMVVVVDGKVKGKGLVKKSDNTLSAKELAKKKTEAALAKKKEEAKAKKGTTVAAGGVNQSVTSFRPGGDISH
eukprot:CAMPEP_0181315250 /NCGR_PEP_ID=MMETSP1101-20121128/15269_1 /TAXON_ID=46948 /ORGANISM="Rhodomonas abbreviata, Strain Caron Lab Isolate" /LENGTH=132 /DNA_ID=CAMNT_0023422433 /DNA_START=49 /DNA_END=447 /DNA_ORIENTATION=+